MKNKLLLLSAALFGAVSFGNYVHSMDLTQDQKREACINRLSEIGEVSSILIENGLNTTKEDFDFICQKDPSIIYQGLTISLKHTFDLYNKQVFSKGETIENYNFLISNIVQTTGTNHEGLARLNNALPIFSDLEDLFSSDIICREQFDYNVKELFHSNVDELNKIFKPILNYSILDRKYINYYTSTEEYKYGYEKNSIEYAIKYNDIDSIIKISNKDGFTFDYLLNYMSFLDFAALHGSVDAFKFFSLNNLPVTEKTCVYSIIGGNNEIVQFCKQRNDCFKNYTCLAQSVSFHRYEITNWLLQNYTNHYQVDLQNTIEYNNIPVFLKVIEEQSYENSYKTKLLLYKCCELNQKEMAEILLIDRIVDVNFKASHMTKNAIEVAKTDEMRDLLRQYGAN